MTKHTFIPFHNNHLKINKRVVLGTGVPLLLNSVIKRPISKGSGLSSNKIVGIVSRPSIQEGGALLNHINFGKLQKKRNNIKFLF